MSKDTSDLRAAYVIDDDDDFRHSAVLLLEVAGWKTTGFHSAAEFLDVQSCLPAGPLLLDLRMPGVGGLELLESGLLDASRFATIMVTGHGDIDSAVRSLKAGALDFLEKPFSPEAILQAVEVARSCIVARSIGKPPVEEASELVSRLTEQELHVLKGLICGAPCRVIAHQLCVSVKTVEMHCAKLVRKLDVRSNAQAVRIGILANIHRLES